MYLLLGICDELGGELGRYVGDLAMVMTGDLDGAGSVGGHFGIGGLGVRGFGG